MPTPDDLARKEPLPNLPKGSTFVVILDTPSGKRAEVVREQVVSRDLKGAPGAPGTPGGPKGDKGDRGDLGLTGPKGTFGPPGPPGPKGTGGKGEKGEIGQRGEDGEKGSPGDVQAKGAKGDAGEKGAPGVKGDDSMVAGPPGQKGSAGNQGNPGMAGSAGMKGQKGQKGEEQQNQHVGIDLGQMVFAQKTNSTNLPVTPTTSLLSGGTAIGWTTTGALFNSPQNPQNTSPGFVLQVGSFRPQFVPWETGGGTVTVAIQHTNITFTLTDEGTRTQLAGFRATTIPSETTVKLLEWANYAVKGEKGAMGTAGVKGDIGEKGNTGNQGNQGMKGQKGDDGSTGPPGAAGNPGSAGMKGDKGAPGEKGEPGTGGGTPGSGTKGQKGQKGDDAPAGNLLGPLVGTVTVAADSGGGHSIGNDVGTAALVSGVSAPFAATGSTIQLNLANGARPAAFNGFVARLVYTPLTGQPREIYWDISSRVGYGAANDTRELEITSTQKVDINFNIDVARRIYKATVVRAVAVALPAFSIQFFQYQVAGPQGIKGSKGEADIGSPKGNELGQWNLTAGSATVGQITNTFEWTTYTENSSYYSRGGGNNRQFRHARVTPETMTGFIFESYTGSTLNHRMVMNVGPAHTVAANSDLTAGHIVFSNGAHLHIRYDWDSTNMHNIVLYVDTSQTIPANASVKVWEHSPRGAKGSKGAPGGQKGQKGEGISPPTNTDIDYQFPSLESTTVPAGRQAIARTLQDSHRKTSNQVLFWDGRVGDPSQVTFERPRIFSFGRPSADTTTTQTGYNYVASTTVTDNGVNVSGNTIRINPSSGNQSTLDSAAVANSCILVTQGNAYAYGRIQTRTGTAATTLVFNLLSTSARSTGTFAAGTGNVTVSINPGYNPVGDWMEFAGSQSPNYIRNIFARAPISEMLNPLRTRMTVTMTMPPLSSAWGFWGTFAGGPNNFAALPDITQNEGSNTRGFLWFVNTNISNGFSVDWKRGTGGSANLTVGTHANFFRGLDANGQPVAMGTNTITLPSGPIASFNRSGPRILFTYRTGTGAPVLGNPHNATDFEFTWETIGNYLSFYYGSTEICSLKWLEGQFPFERTIATGLYRFPNRVGQVYGIMTNDQADATEMRVKSLEITGTQSRSALIPGAITTNMLQEPARVLRYTANPTATTGRVTDQIIYNSTDSKYRVYDGSSWVDLS